MSDAYEIDVVGNGFVPGLPGVYGNVSLIGQAGTDLFVLSEDRSTMLASFVLSPFYFTLLAQIGAALMTDLVVSVRDYGAIGDGSTDDTGAVTAAWNVVKANKGVLYFPSPGSYLVPDGMVLQNASNFTIKADRGASLLIGPNTTAKPARATHDVLVIADCTDFSVDGLTIDGRRDTIAGDQYLTVNASSGQKNVTVQDGTKYVVGQYVSVFGGLTANSGNDKTKNDSNFLIDSIASNVLTLHTNLTQTYTGTGTSGGAYVTQYQTGTSSLYSAAGRNMGNEDAQNGLHLLSCSRFVIRNCVAQNVWESPIKMGNGFATTAVTDGCSHGIVMGNMARHGYDQGISVWNSQYITVTGNWCYDAGWAGISFSHCNDCTGSANVCVNNLYSPAFDLNEGSGMAIEGGVRVVLQGNVCTGNNSNGIRLNISPMYGGAALHTTVAASHSAGDTSLVVASASNIVNGCSLTFVDHTNVMIRETIYVSTVSGTTLTLSRGLRNPYVAGSDVYARFGEDCLVTGNVCSQNALSAGVRCDQQINLRIFSNDCSENGLLNGAFVDTQGTYGIQVENHCEGAVIQANTCRCNSQEGIFIDTDCRGVIVNGNDVANTGIKGTNQKNGIKTLGLIDGSIINNKVFNCTGDGIALENGGGNQSNHLQVLYNVCMYNNSSGIRADNGGQNVSFIGNQIAYNGDAGMKILGYKNSLFQSNQCFNQNGQEAIRFDDNGTDYCLDNKVFDNLLFDDRGGSASQSWGFRELNNSARTVLRGNRTYGNTNSAQISLVATSRIAPDVALDSNSHAEAIIGAYNAIMPSSDMQNATFNVWIDEATNALKFQTKYSNGTVKNGSISLA